MGRVGVSELVPTASLLFQKAPAAKQMLSSSCALWAYCVCSLTSRSSGCLVVRSLEFQKLEAPTFRQIGPRAGGAAGPLRPASAGRASSHRPCQQRLGLAGVWARGAGRLYEHCALRCPGIAVLERDRTVPQRRHNETRVYEAA